MKISDLICTASLLCWYSLSTAAEKESQSKPGALTLVAVVTDDVGLGAAHDVQLRDGLAYVAGKAGSIAIVDVKRPGAPRLLWSARDPLAFDDAESVLPLEGDRLLVGTQDVLLFDVARPTNPKLMTRIHRPPGVHTINGFARRGHIVYGANKLGQIFAVDVSAVDRVEFFGARNTYELDGLHAPHDVAVSGEFLVVAAPQGFGYRNQPGKLGVYRVASPPSGPPPPAVPPPTRYDPSRAPSFEGMPLPAEQWSLVGKVEDLRIAGVNRVRTRGALAYLACATTHLKMQAVPGDPNRGVYANNVSVVDLTEPANPQIRGQIAFGKRGPNGLEVAGNVVFAAGGQEILAIDVSDPTNPREAARFASAEVFPGGGPDLHDLVYRDGYLFATAQNSNSLVILKVGDELRRQGELDSPNFYYR